MLAFLFSLLMAVGTGQADFHAESATMSTSQIVSLAVGVDWPCDVWGTSDTMDETCWIVLDSAGWHDGP